MLTKDEAIQLLHVGKVAQKDQLLITMAYVGEPSKATAIKDAAAMLNVRGAKDWNVNAIVAQAPTMIVRAAAGVWELSAHGKAQIEQRMKEAGLTKLATSHTSLRNNGAPASFVESASPQRKAFIVHGHDELLKTQVARLFEALGFDAIILHERPNRGKTIIEKFEDNSDVGVAVALLTPDDIGSKAPGSGAAPTLVARARQNVVFEMGFFFGKLGRGRVIALYKEGTELPSDVSGIVYLPVDSAGKWKFDVATELEAAGYAIDRAKVK